MTGIGKGKGNGPARKAPAGHWINYNRPRPQGGSNWAQKKKKPPAPKSKGKGKGQGAFIGPRFDFMDPRNKTPIPVPRAMGTALPYTGMAEFEVTTDPHSNMIVAITNMGNSGIIASVYKAQPATQASPDVEGSYSSCTVPLVQDGPHQSTVAEYVTDGNYDALAREAPQYTKGSVFNVGKGTDRDVLRDLREYMETCQNGMETNFNGEVMNCSDGSPYMEVTHTVNNTGGKKQRSEPKYLSPANKKVMDDAGLCSDYCLPANNTHAKMQSLRFQCARTIPNEGDPDYRPVADKIDEMGKFLMTTSVWGPDTHDYKWLAEFCGGFDDKNSGWSKRWKALDKKAMFAKHGRELIKIVCGRMLMRAVVKIYIHIYIYMTFSFFCFV